MLLGLILSVVGLVVLSLAADQFVRGAARLAVVLRMAPIVVGAVVVGFGTSAPEMLVSTLAAANGRLDIGVGNIIGSNVANISLVLGAASFVAVVPVSSSVVRRDAAVSVAAVTLFALLVQGDVSRLEGLVLVAALMAWFVLVLTGARTGGSASDMEDLSELVGEHRPALGVETLRTVVSLALVAGSAYILVEGAERVAEALNLSGGFVGYTMVAVGTSAPELVTAVAAARQRETELLVGNLLGSNVFNSLAVGGAIGLGGAGARRRRHPADPRIVDDGGDLRGELGGDGHRPQGQPHRRRCVAGSVGGEHRSAGRVTVTRPGSLLCALVCVGAPNRWLRAGSRVDLYIGTSFLYNGAGFHLRLTAGSLNVGTRFLYNSACSLYHGTGSLYDCAASPHNGSDRAASGGVGASRSRATAKGWPGGPSRSSSGFPHDPGGLHPGPRSSRRGTMYESTGLWGRSSLRAVTPATGEVTAQVNLLNEYFGEGLTVAGDEIVQLTWQSGTALVYDRATLERLGEHRYEGEGWGLCEMDGELIMSDGSDRLARRDPQTFELLGTVTVTAAGYGGQLDYLNELECVQGLVIANVWQTDRLLVIDPDTGRVVGVIDAGPLVDDVAQASAGSQIDVLNGVAVDEETATLWMTGKLWPRLYRVRVVEVP